MTETPLVSIAAINYNNATYVQETLNSIRDLHYPNVELIIVDDCSTDNSVQLMERWLSDFKGNYRFIKHETNKGVVKACNTGLQSSSGKYFSLIATDDLVMPEKLGKQVAILEASDDTVAGVYSDAWLIDEHTQSLPGLFIDNHRKFIERPSGDIYEVLLQGNYIPGMTLVFKRSVFDDIGPFDEDLAYEDYDMWLRIARKYKILFSEEISSRYRIRPGSLSSTIRNWKPSDCKIFLKHIGASLPIDRLRNIALDAYVHADADTMPYLHQLALQTGDRYLLVADLLCHYKIPVELGDPTLANVLAQLAAGMEPLIAVAGDAQQRFLDIVVPVMPLHLLRELARRIFHGLVDYELSFLHAMARSSKDIYLSAAWLLSRYHVSEDVGAEILLLCNHLGSLTNFVLSESENVADVLQCFYPILPPRLLRKLVRDAYKRRDAELLPFLQHLWKVSRDKYYKAALLLWKHNIRADVAEIILTRIESYILAGRNGLYINMCIYKDVAEARKRYNN